MGTETPSNGGAARARANQQAAATRVARRTRDLLSWDNGKRANPEAPYDEIDPDEEEA